MYVITVNVLSNVLSSHIISLTNENKYCYDVQSIFWALEQLQELVIYAQTILRQVGFFFSRQNYYLINYDFWRGLWIIEDTNRHTNLVWIYIFFLLKKSKIAIKHINYNYWYFISFFIFFVFLTPGSFFFKRFLKRSGTFWNEKLYKNCLFKWGNPPPYRVFLMLFKKFIF